jgi:hypothetical protein
MKEIENKKRKRRKEEKNRKGRGETVPARYRNSPRPTRTSSRIGTSLSCLADRWASIVRIFFLQ